MSFTNPLKGILAAAGGRLTGDAKRALIRSTLPGFLEADLSGSQALSIYRDAGLGIRTSDFYDIQRDVLGVFQRSQRVRYVGRSNIPTDAVFEDARTPQQARYRYVGLLEYEDPQTGERGFAHMAYETDTKRSRGEMESEIADAFEASDTFQGKRALSSTVRFAYIDRTL